MVSCGVHVYDKQVMIIYDRRGGVTPKRIIVKLSSHVRSYNLTDLAPDHFFVCGMHVQR